MLLDTNSAKNGVMTHFIMTNSRLMKIKGLVLEAKELL